MPVELNEITDEMLRPIRAAANKSMLPQTVFASEAGREFGIDCALVSGAMVEEGKSPSGAVGEAMLTVLPEDYFYWRGYRAAEREGRVETPKDSDPVISYARELLATSIDNTQLSVGYQPKSTKGQQSQGFSL